MQNTHTRSSSHFLICDFFKNLHHRNPPIKETESKEYYKNLLRKHPSINKLKVFLCGKELDKSPTSKYFDKRIQIKNFLNTKMGCQSFLGEDIEEIKVPTEINLDALTIEVSEAETSDLIFIFLESFGTTAELTAFVQRKETIDKLVVFNEKQHAGTKSFLNIGPLKLLSRKKPESVIFYDPNQLINGLSEEVITHLDGAIARAWFKKSLDFHRIDPSWTYEKFITLATIHVLFPITKEELTMVLTNRLTEQQIDESLKLLKKEKYTHLRKKRILEPAKDITSIGISNGFVNDISNCRSSFLFNRLKVSDFEQNYDVLLGSEREQKRGLDCSNSGD